MRKYLKSYIFCDKTPCSPLKVNRRFGRTCRLHLQGRRIRQARNQREAGSKQGKNLFVLRLGTDSIFFPGLMNFETGICPVHLSLQLMTINAPRPNDKAFVQRNTSGITTSVHNCPPLHCLAT
jgi:hypothetical protein